LSLHNGAEEVTVEIIRGTVIRSKAGHDKGRFYAVLDVLGRTILVADGSSRTICNPKRKNMIHVSSTRTVLSEEMLDHDESIRNALKRFDLQPSEGVVNV